VTVWETQRLSKYTTNDLSLDETDGVLSGRVEALICQLWSLVRIELQSLSSYFHENRRAILRKRQWANINPTLANKGTIIFSTNAFRLKRAKSQSTGPSSSGSIPICEPFKWSEYGSGTHYNPTEQEISVTVRHRERH